MRLLKARYLSDPCVTSFVAFVRDLVVQGSPGLALRIGPPGQRIEVDTLIDVWLSAGGRGGCPVERTARLRVLRRELSECLQRAALARHQGEARLADMELLFLAVQALHLAGVNRDAYQYLVSHAQHGDLGRCLTAAATLLGRNLVDSGRLSVSGPGYDFGLSGVYALLNGTSVIYDERLGAALGLLSRWYLERQSAPGVPACLRFMVGAAAPYGRDPSVEPFRFAEPRPGPEHARWTLQATWILDTLARDTAIAKILQGTRRDRLRQLEAALWVLGDDVTDQMSLLPRRRSGARRPGWDARN